jgi:hypothetical protein
MTFGIIYVLYSSFTQTYNLILVFSICAVTLEGLTLMLNGWRCPLTDLAMRYGATEEQARVTSIFCPRWFVPHVFKVYGILFIMGLVMVLMGYAF